MLPSTAAASPTSRSRSSWSLVGLALGYALLRLAGVLGRVSSLVGGVEQELVPVLNKAGGSIDRVNDQLDKLDVVTDSAVDAVESIDTVLRVVAGVVKLPAQKVAAWTAGLVHGLAALGSSATSRPRWRPRASRPGTGGQLRQEFESEADEEKNESGE